MNIPHQAYDAFFKENLPEVAPTLLSLLTQREIVSVVERKTDLSHAVHNRRLDFVLEATDAAGETELAQIEEETGNDADLGEKLLGQLVAAKEAFGQYPTQYVGFMTRKAERYGNGLEVKNRRGEVVALLRIIPFNFLDLPSKPFFDLETPAGFSTGMFLDLSGSDETELMGRFLRLLPTFNEKERDKVAVGATLALNKAYIGLNFYLDMMQALFSNPDYGREFALHMAFEAPYLSDHVKAEVKRQILQAVEAERRADKILTAQKLRAAGVDDSLIRDVTGLEPEEY